MSRRLFLRSGAAAAALAAGAQFTFAAEPPKPQTNPAAKPEEKHPRVRKRKQLSPTTKPSKYSEVRVGFIGINGRGRPNLETFNNLGVNVVAVCDTNTEWLESCAEELDRPVKTYPDFRDMLEKEGKNLDGVVISTPDHTHAVAAMMAMRMGKHVYCEKPLTYDIHEARTLTEAARKYGVKTQMGNQGSASDAIRRQVEYVKSGIVGNILEAHVYTNRPIWPQGKIAPTDKPEVPKTIKWDQWLGPAPYRPFHPDYLPFKWRGWWDFGTGALGDMACHLCNSAFWSLDLKNPAVTNAFQNGMTVDSPPHWSIIKWEFPEFHGRPAVKLFWYDGGALPPHTLMEGKQFPGEAYNGVVFVGEKGKIAAGYMQDPFLVNDQQQKDIKPPDKFLPRSIGHHAEWLEAIMGGPACASNFDHAGPLTEMVLVGNLAVRTGQRIEWDAARMRVLNNRDAQKYVKRDYRKGWEL